MYTIDNIIEQYTSKFIFLFCYATKMYRIDNILTQQQNALIIFTSLLHYRKKINTVIALIKTEWKRKICRRIYKNADIINICENTGNKFMHNTLTCVSCQLSSFLIVIIIIIFIIIIVVVVVGFMDQIITDLFRRWKSLLILPAKC